MPFRFVYICDLLEKLDHVYSRRPPYLPKDAEQKSREVISVWFNRHKRMIRFEADGLAFLSTILPDIRTDKVYELKEKSLERVISRALSLSTSRHSDLVRWRDPGAGDLGDCLERVQKQAEMALQPTANEVTIEEIEHVLLVIASKSRFSSPAIRALVFERTQEAPTDLLGQLYQRLQARESKWLTRLVLKSYEPLIIPENFVYKLYDPFLSRVLKVHAEISAALCLLQRMGNTSQARVKGTDVLSHLRPTAGIKIGRQPFLKARCIKHCVDMAHNRRMSVETKYDGEYCQIHVDMSKAPQQQIKIFSKSGKDSTRDRIKIHSVIRKCLELDGKQCRFLRQCVLEGELLVYSDKDHKIMDFHKIRKHVSRSGSFIGVELDSQAHEFEHLMLVFFDILVLDDEPVLGMKHWQRMHLLERTVKPISGRAEFGERQTINFSQPEAAGELRRAFARCISMHGEGLIMKPSGDPYFNFRSSGGFRSCCIKLKKEYIGKFGDVGDFAVVGASYDATKAKSYQIPNLLWTDFYIGCLENKDRVTRWGEKPRFVVVSNISLNKELMGSLVTNRCRTQSRFENSFDLRIAKGIANGKPPSTLFIEPLVFDINCFGFDKEGNTGFWTMRFPRVTKVHFDRTFLDTISFEELQIMAEKSRSDPYNVQSQEETDWIKNLEGADARGIAVDASTQQSETQSNALIPTAQDSQNQHFKSKTNGDFEIMTDETGQVITCTAPIIETNIPSAPYPSNKKKRLSTTQPIDSPLYKKQERRHLKYLVTGDWTLKKGDIGPNTAEWGAGELTQNHKSSSRPLSDITNTTSTSSSTHSYRRQSADDGSDNHGASNKTHKASNFLIVTVDREETYVPTTCITTTSNDIDTSADREGNGCSTSHIKTRPLDSHVTELEKRLCHVAGTSCIFQQRNIALTPCVVSLPCLTEDLLPCHGIRSTTTYHAWAMPQSTPGKQGGDHKARKMLLAEKTRAKETEEAIRHIQELRLTKPSGSKEWIDVYDWRLLEHVGKIEKCAEITEDVWRRYWIGSV